MKLAILDDYQRVALSTTHWSVLEDRLTITAFDQHLGDLDAVAEALLDFDVIVVMRERTPFPSALLERLPKLKLLVTTGSDLAHSWALCLAGLPGRVHVPESEMVRFELDTRLLFHGERCLNVLSEGETVRLQPIEQLAQRYQKLIADQAARLLGEQDAPAAS